MKNIAILYICTGRYICFWDKFYSSCEQHFLPDIQKTYYVFTDAKKLAHKQANTNIHKIYQKHLAWPYSTLMRFKIFLSQKDFLIQHDYVLFCNANMRFLEDVLSTDIVLSDKQNYIAVTHPTMGKDKGKSWLEKKPQSTAYIDIEKYHPKQYAMGSLQGGRSAMFLDACTVMSDNIEKDLQNNIIAVWHDETHWNCFLHGRTDVKYLPQQFLYSKNNTTIKPSRIRVILLDKKKMGGHYFMRSTGIGGYIAFCIRHLRESAKWVFSKKTYIKKN